MDPRRVAGIAFTLAVVGVVAFQIALALGAPWGSYAMGGTFPGRYPPVMRVAAVAQAVLLVLMAGVVLSRSGLALRAWSRASVAFLLVVSSVIVATGRAADGAPSTYGGERRNR